MPIRYSADAAPLGERMTGILNFLTGGQPVTTQQPSSFTPNDNLIPEDEFNRIINQPAMPEPVEPMTAFQEYQMGGLMGNLPSQQDVAMPAIGGPDTPVIAGMPAEPMSDAVKTARSLLINFGVNSMQEAGNEINSGSEKGKGIFNTIKNFLGNEETMANLAIAFNSMRLNPDPNLADAMQARVERIGESRTANRTADALLARGMITPEQAEMLRLGIPYKDVIEKPSEWEKKLSWAMENPEKAQFAKEMGIFGGQPIIIGGQQMTPGFEAIDKKYAEQHVEWITGGGSDALGNVAQIETVLDKLERGDRLTGPEIGFAPDFYLAITNPEALDARERVEEVVQRNLRAILGAQFTEKEGERLISRAYNPKLSPQQNAGRLRKLLLQMRTAAEQKDAMAEYFSVNGTLMGYTGKMPNINDFYNALEGGTTNRVQTGDIIDGWQFMGGDPSNEANWKKAGGR